MKVTIYTLPNCVQCDMTKKQFDKGGVQYSTVDLLTNPVATERLRAEGFLQAPIVETPNKTWSGFKLDLIKNVIAEVHLEEVQSA